MKRIDLDVQGTGYSSFNNGAGGKTQKEAAKREQEQPAARASLKARLAKKRAQVAGKDHEAREMQRKTRGRCKSMNILEAPK